MNCYGESVLDDTIFCGYPKCILLNMTINCNTKDHIWFYCTQWMNRKYIKDLS